jgi:hypothetical protein
MCYCRKCRICEHSVMHNPRCKKVAINSGSEADSTARAHGEMTSLNLAWLELDVTHRCAV